MEPSRDPATAAVGFFELGMMEDAWAELETLPPEIRFTGLAFETRIAIICATGQYEDGRIAAQKLVVEFPEYPALWIHWAHCLERTRPLEDARAVLCRAAQRHPDSAFIWYNLASYACTLSEMADAARILARAVELDPEIKVLAAANPELAPIHCTGAAG